MSVIVFEKSFFWVSKRSTQKLHRDYLWSTIMGLFLMMIDWIIYIYTRKRNYYFSFILEEVSIVFICIALMKLITDWLLVVGWWCALCVWALSSNNLYNCVQQRFSFTTTWKLETKISKSKILREWEKEREREREIFNKFNKFSISICTIHSTMKMFLKLLFVLTSLLFADAIVIRSRRSGVRIF